ncbi:uncharacterized protein MONBRDRAFT_5818 [Monosiga brevicollis MX1]|uniref:RRM domain-containing protein n=1 Tax=Monosiga brevicollis TaxID=81824 RepID=A9USJ8_MONBE|nr:uncharacterized protein MONBRDRAFT_5818 [Monosiga brevicollis MX1]EDQ91794.1 predicted protein [Monosiga brevicollis MX1]|eukprot:XP_001743080.1 hypothetical protein [Monosiga brevicollis MX1]
MGKKKAGKAQKISLSEFLADHDAPSSDISLPSAPTALHQEVDIEDLPKFGPFKIFAGNLPFEFEDDQLLRFFQDFECDVISASVAKSGGRTRGFGYVELSSRTEMKKALDLNNAYSGFGGGFGRDDREPRRGGFDDFRREDMPARGASGFESARGPRSGGFEDARGPRSGAFEGFSREDMPARGSAPPRNNEPSAWRRADDAPRDAPGASAPAMRPKLNLKQREKPVETEGSDSSGSNSAIFGGAKPVDANQKILEMEAKAAAKAQPEPEPKAPAEPKANPFGDAKPVDANQKLLELEAKKKAEAEAQAAEAKKKAEAEAKAKVAEKSGFDDFVRGKGPRENPHENPREGPRGGAARAGPRDGPRREGRGPRQDKEKRGNAEKSSKPRRQPRARAVEADDAEFEGAEVEKEITVDAMPDVPRPISKGESHMTNKFAGLIVDSDEEEAEPSAGANE